MKNIAYVNGTYQDADQATISIYDRGFLFADAVYEVCAVIDRKLLDRDNHIDRLHRSMAELEMPKQFDSSHIIQILDTLIAKNQLDQGTVYLQVSRGASERDFIFPKEPRLTLVAFTQHKNIVQDPNAKNGYRIITLPDLRWQRCDIKTVGLLYASMAKSQAIAQGVNDAWLIDSNGFVTEGTSSNAFIITRDNKLVTRQLGHQILPGITRQAVMSLAQEAGLSIEQRPFSLNEALSAKEAFSTSASTFTQPVIEIDGQPIDDGLVGPLSLRLRERYIEIARQA